LFSIIDITLLLHCLQRQHGVIRYFPLTCVEGNVTEYFYYQFHTCPSLARMYVVLCWSCDQCLGVVLAIRRIALNI
jgi:hypothetical protein